MLEFDAAFYAASYGVAPGEARAHFARSGWKAGNWPHPLFDTVYYLANHDVVMGAFPDPLEEFNEVGAALLRVPVRFFNRDWYLLANRDVLKAGEDPFGHFVKHGDREFRSPGPDFSSRAYVATLGDEDAARDGALRHYFHVGLPAGWADRRRPVEDLGLVPFRDLVASEGDFNQAWYLKANPDVAHAGVDALDHFVRHGAGEQRDPNPDFKTRDYARRNPAFRTYCATPFEHYLRLGKYQKRKPVEQPVVAPTVVIPEPAQRRGLAGLFFRRGPQNVAPPAAPAVLNHKQNGDVSAAALYLHMAELGQRYDAGRRESEPLITFVSPLYNTKPEYLDELLRSLRSQRPGSWRLIISDDGSTNPATLAWLRANEGQENVTIITGYANAGIAPAQARGIERAETPWIGLLDSDDVIAPGAVGLIVDALRENPDCLFMYTDEAFANERMEVTELFLKPAFDDVFLSCMNYINHLSIYNTERLRQVGSLRDGFQGSQDYDVVLRYVQGLKSENCLHLPYPAYVWRREATTFSARNVDLAKNSARAALVAAYGAAGERVEVKDALGANLHRLWFKDPAVRSLTAVLSSYDDLEGLTRSIDALRTGKGDLALDIVVVDLGSRDRRLAAFYEELAVDPSFRGVIGAQNGADHTDVVRRVLELGKGEAVLLLGSGLVPQDDDSLPEMLGCFNYPDAGIVGGTVLDTDGNYLCAGIAVDAEQRRHCLFRGEPGTNSGPTHRLWVRQKAAAVSGACMMVRRSFLDDWLRSGGPAGGVRHWGASLCDHAAVSGASVVWTPFARYVDTSRLWSASEPVADDPGASAADDGRSAARDAAQVRDAANARRSNPWYRPEGERLVYAPRETLQPAR